MGVSAPVIGHLRSAAARVLGATTLSVVLVAIGVASGPPTAHAATLRVELVLAPDVFSAGSGTHEAAFVQLVDADGNPSVSDTSVTVFLVSSNPSVLSVQGDVHIVAGSSFGTAFVSTGASPGEATIEAWYAGARMDAVDVVVMQLPAADAGAKLRLDVAPGRVVAGDGEAGYLTISLIDSVGRLVVAQEDHHVILRSSDPAVVSPPNFVTVFQGESSTTVGFYSANVGETVVSAISQSFEPAFADVVSVGPGARASSLRLWPITNAYSRTFEDRIGLIAQAVDQQGLPTVFPCASIDFSSSKPDTVSVRTPQSPSDCGILLHYLEIPIRTGDIAGTAVITATGDGLAPATAQISLESQRPLKIATYVAPRNLLATDFSGGVIVVQVLDNNGRPVTTHGGIDVELLTPGLPAPYQLTIQPGQSYARIPIAEAVSESAQIWVVSEGLTSSLATVRLDQLSLESSLSVERGMLFPGDRFVATVAVMLEGAPVRGASVAWSYPGGDIRTADRETNNEGIARAVLVGTEAGDMPVIVEVTKGGYVSSTSSASASIIGTHEKQPVTSPTVLGIPAWVLLLATLAALAGSALTRSRLARSRGIKIASRFRLVYTSGLRKRQRKAFEIGSSESLRT